MKAILAGSMAIPKSLVDPTAIRKSQTHKYLRLGDKEPVEVLSFREDAEYVYVPRQFGLDLCKRLQIEHEDRTSTGEPVTFPRVPAPRDYQVPVIEELVETSQGFYDFLFRARTGFGKTISALLVAARLGVRTIIIVDQENLRDQWVEALQTHFGIDKPGTIQGKKLNLDAPVTVAMVQTLAQREMPEWVYSHFGLLVVDEVHVIGAPTFSQILLDFNAAYRFGVSATPNRRDGLQKLIEYNLGKVRVYVADEHSRSSVYVRESQSVFSWYANTAKTTGRYLSEVADDGARNLLVAESAVTLYESGRDTLVLSDRIEQLTHLRNLCYYLGVPEEDMGVYTGQTFAFQYGKQVSPPRRPEFWERGTEYTPVELQLIARKTPKAELKAIKEKAKLIFATYQMFSKGVDVPRLAAGVDATPRAQAEQVHGRILREVTGKAKPIWVTIADINSYRSLFQFRQRVADYDRNNAALFELRDNGEVVPCNAETLRRLKDRETELRSARIETLYEGVNTVRFPKSPTLPERGSVSGIRSRLESAPVSRLRTSPVGSSARSLSMGPKRSTAR